MQNLRCPPCPPARPAGAWRLGGRGLRSRGRGLPTKEAWAAAGRACAASPLLKRMRQLPEVVVGGRAGCSDGGEVRLPGGAPGEVRGEHSAARHYRQRLPAQQPGWTQPEIVRALPLTPLSVARPRGSSRFPRSPPTPPNLVPKRPVFSLQEFHGDGLAGYRQMPAAASRYQRPLRSF